MDIRKMKEMLQGSTSRARSCIRSLQKTFKGFTLIETFVAITLLISSIAGPLSIASSGLSAAMTASEQTVALFLAQDSLEYIHWIRDTNKLGGVHDWLYYLDPCVSADGTATCRFDASQINLPPASPIASCSGTCPKIMFDSARGIYNYDPVSDSNKETKYIRTVSITYPLDSQQVEASILTKVEWRDARGQHSFILRDNLLKWQ